MKCFLSIALLALLPGILLFSSCSAEKLLEKGDAEAAFAKSAAQFERNPDRRLEEGEVLAQAYYSIQAQDYLQTKQLLGSTSEDRFERAVLEFTDLQARRERFDRIRLASKRVIPSFDEQEPNYAVELAEAKRMAALQLVQKAQSLYAYARNGDKASARIAVGLLEKSERYEALSADLRQNLIEMEELGRLYIGFVVEGHVEPQDISALERAFAKTNSNRWVEVIPYSQDPSASADFWATLDVFEPYVGALQYSSNTETVRKCIIEQRKIGQDTSGQDIFEDVELNIEASVKTMAVRRDARLEAELFVSRDGRQSLFNKDLEVRFRHESFRTEVFGDSRAIEGVQYPYLNHHLDDGPSRFRIVSKLYDRLPDVMPRVDWIALEERHGLALN